jgi:hypothetical protein
MFKATKPLQFIASRIQAVVYRTPIFKFKNVKILKKRWEYKEAITSAIHRFQENLIQLGGKYCTIFS